MAFIDYAIPLIIIVGLALAIICKATGQTVPELFRDLADFFAEKKEDAVDNTVGNY